MANTWYCSYPLWNALPVWQASHTYTLGQIVRPATAFQVDNRCVYVITTAGTSGGSEPTWNTNVNATTADNGMVWTNITGVGSYGWSAPAGSMSTLNAGYDVQLRISGGDTVYIDSNSNETSCPQNTCSRNANANTPVKVYSVNASGSVPPVAADYLPGASFDFGNIQIILDTNFYWYGIGFLNASNFLIGYNGNGILYIRDCTLSQASSQTYFITFDNSPLHAIFDNTQVIPYTGNITNYLIYFNQGPIFEWWNTSNPTNGYYVSQFPFSCPNGNWFHLKGVDLSVFTTTNCPNGLISVGYQNSAKFTFENCYLGMPVTSIAINQQTNSATGEQPTIEVVNSYAGTENYNNSRFTSIGQLLTETDTTLNGGATDGLTSFSHQITTSSYAGGKDTMQSMDGFPIFFNNTTVGSAQNAVVQVLATRQLTSDDIRLDLDYMSSSSYPQSKTVSTSPLLTATTNLATTTSTWTNGAQPAYVSYAATALQGNSYWTRTSDTLASFSGSGNACTVLINNISPFAPCYLEFQNQTWGSNLVAIGFIRSSYSSSSPDPRANNSFGYMALYENGSVYGNNGYGPYTSLGTSISTGSIIRMLWDGKGNIAWAINGGLWNGTNNDSSVLTSGNLVNGLINYMPINDIIPFIEVKNGTASSWLVASDVTNCTYTPPTGSTYLPVASNTYIPQKLTVSFTAQNTGLVRALVKVTNPVTQLWYDPSVSLT